MRCNPGMLIVGDIHGCEASCALTGAMPHSVTRTQSIAHGVHARASDIRLTAAGAVTPTPTVAAARSATATSGVLPAPARVCSRLKSHVSAGCQILQNMA